MGSESASEIRQDTVSQPSRANVTPASRARAMQELEGFKEEWISFDMALLIGAGVLMAIVMAFAVMKGDVGVQQTLESWLPGGGRGQVQDISFRIQVPLEAIYLGQTFDVTPPEERQVICEACKGTGARDGAAGVKTCVDCKGTGTQHVRMQLAPGFVQQFQQECNKCQGRGRVVKSRCPHCNGQRVHRRSEPLPIPIPQGCSEGHVLRLSRQGHQVPDVGVGDVVVEITSTSHDRFRREGNDLHTTLQISLKQSLLGFESAITHLDDREIPVSRPDCVTAHKTVLEIKREGIPRGSGSLFITIHVRFPSSITPAQATTIRTLLS